MSQLPASRPSQLAPSQSDAASLQMKRDVKRHYQVEERVVFCDGVAMSIHLSDSLCVSGGEVVVVGANTSCCFPRFERPLIEHLIECECNRKSLGNEATARQQGVTHDMMEIPAATPP